MDAKTDDSAASARSPRHPRTQEPRLWPEHLDIGVLHTNAPAADPMGEAFDYAKEFESSTLTP